MSVVLTFFRNFFSLFHLGKVREREREKVEIVLSKVSRAESKEMPKKHRCNENVTHFIWDICELHTRCAWKEVWCFDVRKKNVVRDDGKNVMNRNGLSVHDHHQIERERAKKYSRASKTCIHVGGMDTNPGNQRREMKEITHFVFREFLFCFLRQLQGDPISSQPKIKQQLNSIELCVVVVVVCLFAYFW